MCKMKEAWYHIFENAVISGLDKNEKGSRLFSSLPMVIILIQYNNLFQLSKNTIICNQLRKMTQSLCFSLN